MPETIEVSALAYDCGLSAVTELITELERVMMRSCGIPPELMPKEERFPAVPMMEIKAGFCRGCLKPLGWIPATLTKPKCEECRTDDR